MQCFKCPGKPVLSFIKPELSEYDRPKIGEGGIDCYACGRLIEDKKESFYHCSKCLILNYCETCRFCDHGHTLIKTVKLSNLNSGYSGNKFICNLCKGHHQAGDRGIWHCTSCEYDVCPGCLP